MLDPLYEPGSVIDVDHRTVRTTRIGELVSRTDESGPIAGTVDGRGDRIERLYGVDPSAVDTLTKYRPATVLTGDFSGDLVREHFEGNGWTRSGTRAGFVFYEHDEHPDFYAAGVSDGVAIKTSRSRATGPDSYLRAHVAAASGERSRIAERTPLRSLLDVIGGGDYVSAITHPSDFDYRGPPGATARGEAWAFRSQTSVRTGAFVFGPDEPGDPEALVKRHVGDDAPPRYVGGHTFGSNGRVGYITAAYDNSALPSADTFRSELRGDAVADAQLRLDREYAKEHAVSPPEAEFSFEFDAEATDVSCGNPTAGVATVTYESGPPLLIRRLYGGVTSISPFFLCGEFDVTERLEPGDVLRMGIDTADIPPHPDFKVLWVGPHRGTNRLEEWEFDP